MDRYSSEEEDQEFEEQFSSESEPDNEQEIIHKEFGDSFEDGNTSSPLIGRYRREIVFLRENEEILVYGQAKLKVLAGTVELLGYTMTEKSQPRGGSDYFNIFAHTDFGGITIKAVGTNNTIASITSKEQLFQQFQSALRTTIEPSNGVPKQQQQQLDANNSSNNDNGAVPTSIDELTLLSTSSNYYSYNNTNNNGDASMSMNWSAMVLFEEIMPTPAAAATAKNSSDSYYSSLMLLRSMCNPLFGELRVVEDLVLQTQYECLETIRNFKRCIKPVYAAAAPGDAKMINKQHPQFWLFEGQRARIQAVAEHNPNAAEAANSKKDAKRKMAKKNKAGAGVTITNNAFATKEVVKRFPILRYPSELREVLKTILLATTQQQQQQQQQRYPIIALCGQKKLGKSTIAKFIVNSLLNSYPRVAYLETDMGQPEFSPSGVVSLSIVDSPLFGPSYMHTMRKPERSYFVGDIRCDYYLTEYMESVKALCDLYHESFSQSMPLVVNTQGWITGAGLDANVETLKHSRANHVICLKPVKHRGPSSSFRKRRRTDNEDDADNNDVLSKEYLLNAMYSRRSNTNLFSPLSAAATTTPTPAQQQHMDDFNVYTLTSPVVEDEISQRNSLAAEAQRTVRFLHYFVAPSEHDCCSHSATATATSVGVLAKQADDVIGRQLEKYNQPREVVASDPVMDNITLARQSSASEFLLHMRPFKVSWNKFRIRIMDDELAVSDYMYVLNGSIVALAIDNTEYQMMDSSDYDPDSHGSFPGILRHTPVCELVCLAIVSGIDPVQKCFYLLVPMLFQKEERYRSLLHKVNTMIRGRLEVPYPLLALHNRIETAYTSRTSLDGRAAGTREFKKQRDFASRG